MGDELKVRLWRRAGHLRVYVTAPDGRDIGWYDPRTGHHVLSDETLAGPFWAVAGTEAARLRALGELDEPPAKPADPAAAVMDDNARHPPHAPPSEIGSPAVRAARWDDLAANKPGEAALARARELRREHPVRTLLGRVLGIRTQARSFAIGARGERRVGHRLDRWAAVHGWRVLHAVPVGRRGADIDHLVIGPFGVVTVNTKTTANPVWVGEYGMTVGGLKVGYIQAARAEAARAAARLSRAAGMSIDVVPAVVFFGPRRFTVRRGGPADVAVLPSPRALRRWLRRQRNVLSPAQAETVYAAARRPVTWA